MEVTAPNSCEDTPSTTCPVEGCDEVFESKHGARIHFRYHTEDEKRDALIGALRELHDNLGRTPTAGEMGSSGAFSVTTYCNYYSSWTDAVRAAGFEPHRHRDITDTELFSELHRLYHELGRTPKTTDMRDHGKFGISTYVNRFSSWNHALKAAGYDPTFISHVNRDDLLAELGRLHQKLRRVPAKSHMNELGRFATRTYQCEFGSWNEAIKAAGMEPNQTFGETWNYYYGPDWSTRREEVIERDGGVCRVCRLSRREAEQDLNIHHIRPARGFACGDTVNYDKMNDLSNLVTLCSSCHQQFEGLWTDCTPEAFAKRARGARR